jgi:hypothetical protein
MKKNEKFFEKVCNICIPLFYFQLKVLLIKFVSPIVVPKAILAPTFTQNFFSFMLALWPVLVDELQLMPVHYMPIQTFFSAL